MLKRIPKKFVYAAGFFSFALCSSIAILIAIEAAVYQESIVQDNQEKKAVWVDGRDAKTPADTGLYKTQHTVGAASTASETLRSAGLPSSLIHDLIVAAKPYANLGNIPSRTVFSLFWDRSTKSKLQKIEYPLNKSERLVMERPAGSQGWDAKVTVREVQKRVETFQGAVETTLWDSAMAAGIDSSVISNLSDIFAWQVNFSREIRSGDSWRLSIDRNYADGHPIGWGNIIAAEFSNGGELFSAVRYAGEDGVGAYYDRNGESLRRLFLKSPVRFSHISSGFTSRRMHPILKINRPHNGVDYAAPTGTPVRAVGDGRVAHANYDNASGNMIKIMHNATYSTSYHHLSRFAPGMRVGQRISQGDIIGYVGSTGLATGPHLHFAFYENGVYVDPQGMRFPSADPVSKDKIPEFMTAAASAIKSLPTWDIRLSHVTPTVIPMRQGLDETEPLIRTH